MITEILQQLLQTAHLSRPAGRLDASCSAAAGKDLECGSGPLTAREGDGWLLSPETPASADVQMPSIGLLCGSDIAIMKD